MQGDADQSKMKESVEGKKRILNDEIALILELDVVGIAYEQIEELFYANFGIKEENIRAIRKCTYCKTLFLQLLQLKEENSCKGGNENMKEYNLLQILWLNKIPFEFQDVILKKKLAEDIYLIGK